jgi:hypothetical protein
MARFVKLGMSYVNLDRLFMVVIASKPDAPLQVKAVLDKHDDSIKFEGDDAHALLRAMDEQCEAGLPE